MRVSNDETSLEEGHRSIISTAIPMNDAQIAIINELRPGAGSVAALDNQHSGQVLEMFAKAAHERGNAALLFAQGTRVPEVFARCRELADSRL